MSRQCVQRGAVDAGVRRHDFGLVPAESRGQDAPQDLAELFRDACGTEELEVGRSTRLLSLVCGRVEPRERSGRDIGGAPENPLRRVEAYDGIVWDQTGAARPECGQETSAESTGAEPGEQENSVRRERGARG